MYSDSPPKRSATIPGDVVGMHSVHVSGTFSQVAQRSARAAEAEPIPQQGSDDRQPAETSPQLSTVRRQPA